MSNPVCSECGARLPEGADRCDLCGAPVLGGASQESASDIPDPQSGDASDPPSRSRQVDEHKVGDDAATAADAAGEKPAANDAGVYCNECGWKNPLRAKFCSRCGSPLQDLAPDEPHTKSAALSAPDFAESDENEAASPSDGELSRYVGVLIGFAVLIVVALYMITVVSKQNVAAETEGAVEAPAEVRSAAVIEEYEAIPIAERHAARVDSFRVAIAQADSSAQLELRRDLVDYLVEIRRIDRAAIEQQRLAKEHGTVAAWRRAGDLLYDWMETVNPERKTDVALLAIDAYERVLEREPDNLDVRADLGWVYQYDPRNPMEAIRHTNMVLEADPDHLAANYNRGVFLLRINRVSDALAQFRKVKDLSSPQSAYYQQADAWIQTVNSQSESERGS